MCGIPDLPGGQAGWREIRAGFSEEVMFNLHWRFSIKIGGMERARIVYRPMSVTTPPSWTVSSLKAGHIHVVLGSWFCLLANVLICARINNISTPYSLCVHILVPDRKVT